MDILIKNMEMPKNYPYRLTLHSDGHVEDHSGYSGHGHYQAIPVPEHGRLVDADKLLADHPKTANWDYMVLECIIRNAPTVVEAS